MNRGSEEKARFRLGLPVRDSEGSLSPFRDEAIKKGWRLRRKKLEVGGERERLVTVAAHMCTKQRSQSQKTRLPSLIV